MKSPIDIEKQRVKDSLIPPIQLVAILWLIKGIETLLGTSFGWLGIYPRQLDGLFPGIFTAPFLHGDIYHLASNTLPIIVLGFLLLHSFKDISTKVILLIYVLSGLGTWLIGRPSYHIGASAVIYGLAFFIFFSGIFRKNFKSIALALLVVFLYGGIIWGLLPLQQGVSFEGHISGALSGIYCAYLYRKHVSPSVRYAWQDEKPEDPNNIIEKPFWIKEEPKNINIEIKDVEETKIQPQKTSDDILNWKI